MKKLQSGLPLCAIVFLLLCIRCSTHVSTPGQAAASQSNPIPIEIYRDMISAQDLAAHTHLLASDAMEGRETGTYGQKQAAYYLASQYRLMGLKANGTLKLADTAALENY